MRWSSVQSREGAPPCIRIIAMPSPSYIVINIPDIGETPSTPATPFVDDDLTPLATEVLISAANSCGFPVSYMQEQEGQLIHNIVPTHKTEYGQISTSSKNDLYLHTELAFHPYQPSHVILLCLRGDETAGTTIASASEIVSHLDSESIDLLKQPFFETGIDESFQNDKNKDFKLVTPILIEDATYEDDMKWTMNFDWQLMSPMNEDAGNALNKFKSAVTNSIKTIILNRGDLMMIDNKRAIHGRTKFQPKYDGTDRWLKRIFAIKHMPPIQHIKGNMIITEFSNG